MSALRLGSAACRPGEQPTKTTQPTRSTTPRSSKGFRTEKTDRNKTWFEVSLSCPCPPSLQLSVQTPPPPPHPSRTRITFPFSRAKAGRFGLVGRNGRGRAPPWSAGHPSPVQTTFLRRYQPAEFSSVLGLALFALLPGGGPTVSCLRCGAMRCNTVRHATGLAHEL